MHTSTSNHPSRFSSTFFKILISHDVASPFWSYIFETLSQIQILSNILLFVEHFSTLTVAETFSKSLSQIIEVVSFSPDTIQHTFLFSARDLLFLAFLGFDIFIYLTIIASFLAGYYKLLQSTKISSLLQILLQLHAKFLFMASSAIFISAYSRPQGESLTFDTSLQPGLYTILIFNLLPALGYCFVSFMPLAKNYMLAHRPTSLDLLDLSFKVFCLIFVEVYTVWPSAKLVFYILCLGIMAQRLYIILKVNPFYLYHGRMVMLWVTSLQFSIVLVLLNFIFQGKESYDPFLVVIITAPILAKFIAGLFKPDYERILNLRPKTPQQANEKISTLIHILNFSSYQTTSQTTSSFKKEELAFMGIVTRHTKSCFDTSCYCKLFLTTKDQPYQGIKFSSDVNSRLKDFQFKLLRENYQEILTEGDKNDIWMMIDFINLLMTSRPSAFPVALSMIRHMKIIKLGYIERHFVHGLMERVNEEINIKIAQNNEQVDANNFFEFRGHAQQFKQELGIATRQVLTFWNIYKDTSPVFINLYYISNEVQNQFEGITQIWNNLKKTYKVLLMKEYRLYSIFLALVQNSPKQSRDVLFELNTFITNKLNNLVSLDKITKETIRDEKNVIIGISMNKAKLGTVIQISPNVEPNLEWKTHDLLNNSINNIIPTFMRDFHSQRLLDHIETGSNKLILKNQLVFAQKKSGFLIPCYIYISPQPNMEKEFTYIGILRPLKQKSEYVLVDENLEILGCTHEVGKELNVIPVKSASVYREHAKEKNSTSFHSYSFERLNSHEMREFSGGKILVENHEKSLVLSLKTGVYFVCSEEVEDFLPMPGCKIYKVERYSRNHHTKSKKFSNEAEISLSNGNEEKDIRVTEGITIHIGKTSETQACSKSTFIPPKNIYDEPEDQENEEKPPYSQAAENPDSENIISESENSETSNSKEIQDVYKFYEDSCQTSSIASRKSSNWREMHEVDLTIKEKPRASRLTILIMTLISFLILVLGGTLGVNSYASGLVNRNGEIANIMRDSTLRLYYFLELHRRTRMLMLIAGNSIPNRFNTSYTNISAYNTTQVNFISGLTVNFANLNNIIGESIFILDQSMINKIYQPVMLSARRPFEPDLYVPLSGAAYEFVQMIVTLRKSTGIKTSNTAALYILKNTLNDILVRSEEIPPVLLSAVKASDKNINDLILVLIIVLCTILCVIIALFIQMEFSYAKAKSRFVNLIMRCDEKDIDINIGRLREFVKSLGDTVDKEKFQQLSTRLLEIKASNKSAKKEKQNIKRVNSRGTDMLSLKRMLKTILLMIFSLVPTFVLYIIFINYNQKIDLLVNNLMKNENILAKYVLNFVSIYEYVSLNMTSTVRGLPIKGQLDQDIQYLKNNFQFYDDIDTGDDGNNLKMKQLVSGNLCDILQTDISDLTGCYLVGEGSATAGIFGMTSYLIRVLTRFKLEFESSDKSNATIARLFKLQQLRDVELVFDLVFKFPFFEIDTILIDSINIQTTLFQNEATTIDVFVVIGCLAFAWLGYKIYYLDGMKERKSFRMILKLFPPRLVKSQGKIRNYLSSDHGNMFDS